MGVVIKRETRIHGASRSTLRSHQCNRQELTRCKDAAYIGSAEDRIASRTDRLWCPPSGHHRENLAGYVYSMVVPR